MKNEDFALLISLARDFNSWCEPSSNPYAEEERESLMNSINLLVRANGFKIEMQDGRITKLYYEVIE